jgi:hypothetical protein
MRISPPGMAEHGSAQALLVAHLKFTKRLCKCSNRKVKENSDGWAAPLVAGEHYELSWPSAPVTPQSLRLEVTDLRSNLTFDATSKAAIPEALWLTLQYKQAWGFIGVKSNDGKYMAFSETNAPVPALNTSGTFWRERDNNTVTVMVAGEPGRSAGGENRVWGVDQRWMVEASSCPPEGCPAPDVAVVIRDNRTRYASTSLAMPSGSLLQCALLGIVNVVVHLWRCWCGC